jgi:hypothetical protein
VAAPDRVPASDDAVRLARDPGAAAGFHTMTTKIWSLFQYPPKLELAAAAAVPLCC